MQGARWQGSTARNTWASTPAVPSSQTTLKTRRQTPPGPSPALCAGRRLGAIVNKVGLKAILAFQLIPCRQG